MVVPWTDPENCGSRKRVAAGLADGDIRLVDPYTSRAAGRLSGHSRPIRVVEALRKNGGGWLLSGGEDGMLRMWDLVRSQCAVSSIDPGNRISTLACVPDQKVFVQASDDGQLRLWEASGGQLRLCHKVSVYPNLMSYCDVVDHTTAVMGSVDGRVSLRDIRQESRQRAEINLSASVTHVGAVHPGIVFVVTADGQLHTLSSADLSEVSAPVRLDLSSPTVALRTTVQEQRGGKRAVVAIATADATLSMYGVSVKPDGDQRRVSLVRSVRWSSSEPPTTWRSDSCDAFEWGPDRQAAQRRTSEARHPRAVELPELRSLEAVAMGLAEDRARHPPLDPPLAPVVEVA